MKKFDYIFRIKIIIKVFFKSNESKNQQNFLKTKDLMIPGSRTLNNGFIRF
jgi:hypothetical protein